jgi:hypothetical protein
MGETSPITLQITEIGQWSVVSGQWSEILVTLLLGQRLGYRHTMPSF